MMLVALPALADETEQQRLFAEVATKTHEAVTPVKLQEEETLDWWEPRHNQIAQRLLEGNVDLLFLGDSITHGWESTGKAVWDQYYASRNALNMGCGWDRTQHLLWRLDHVDLSKVSPKLAVVLIGTNNSGGDGNTPQEIADGIVAVCQRLRSRLPEMQILLLAIFPRDHEPSPQRARCQAASRLASAVADNETIFFLDLADVFLDEHGMLPAELMPDFLHPNEQGYRVWAAAMEPMIKQLLEE